MRSCSSHGGSTFDEYITKFIRNKSRLPCIRQENICCDLYGNSITPCSVLLDTKIVKDCKDTEVTRIANTITTPAIIKMIAIFAGRTCKTSLRKVSFYCSQN